MTITRVALSTVAVAGLRGLRLDSSAGIRKGGASGAAVVAGNVEESLLVAGLLNTAALAQSTSGNSSSGAQSAAVSGSNTPAQQGSAQTQQKAGQAPEGWVLVEERTVVLTANEPQNHFLRAQQLLSQKDKRAAAGEVRMAAAYVDMQASRGRGPQPDAQLTQSAERLRQAARQIEQQRGNEQQLKQTFAQVNVALAQHLQSFAQREIRNGKSVMAGHDLNTAADSLAAAFAWDGQPPPQQVSSAIRDSKQLAVQLLAPEAAQEQQQANSSNGNGSNSADRAQTASAQQAGQSSTQAPANAEQIIKQLGQAVQQSSSTLQQGGDTHAKQQNQ